MFQRHFVFSLRKTLPGRYRVRPSHKWEGEVVKLIVEAIFKPLLELHHIAARRVVIGAVAALVFWHPPLLVAADPLPPAVNKFLVNQCSDCHSGEEAEGSIHLDQSETDWNDRQKLHVWERVYDALREETMPPSDAVAPSQDERKRMTDWLLDRLNEHACVGGTVARRLNREEYEHTIEDLFDLEEFRVPNSFPADDSSGGFDNVGSGLFLSPPLMAQYLQLATQIADEILPPDRGPLTAVPKLYQIAPADLTGQIFGLRWCDGPCYSEAPSRQYADEFYVDRLRKDRRHYAAMLRLGGGSRGMTQEEFYLKTLALIQSDDLDLTDPRLDKLPEEYGGGLSHGPHRWIKSYVHEELFRFGPALDVMHITIEGPLRLIEDEAMKRRKARTRQFLSERDPAAPIKHQAASVLRPFLGRAFRRPVTEAQLREYFELATSEQYQPYWRLEDGLHLAIRRALISPQFLYRSTRPGVLDDFDLASRLSYFLTSAPPDEQLISAARRGELSDPEILERETRRLLDAPRAARFVNSLSGQWLGTRRLVDIMPDPRLLKFFAADRLALVAETEQFVAEILRENHPLESFIDPGFSYRSARTNKIYGDDLQGFETRRVSFPKGGRLGGILGLGSVMMATANGVDTHPVHRGVWLLENVLGMPTPPPPADVPSIAPDTSGTTSMRDQLNAHRADEKCARCHNLIDPLGLVLENFDPVGRWRDHYPRYAKPNERLTEEFYSSIGKGTLKGKKVDAKGMMPDGRQLEDVTDLKRYVLDRMDLFSRCLTEKLLTYGTGRRLGFGDRRVVNQIVADVRQEGNGFRDLIVAVVQSESFRTK